MEKNPEKLFDKMIKNFDHLLKLDLKLIDNNLFS